MAGCIVEDFVKQQQWEAFRRGLGVDSGSG